MLIPVYILTVLAAIAGVLQIPGVTHFFSDWLEPTVYGGVPMLEPSTSNDWIATVVATSAGVIGILAASRIWGQAAPTPRCAFPRPLAILSERTVLLGRALLLRLLRAGRLAVGDAAPHASSSRCCCSPPDALGSLAVRAGRAFAVVQTGLVRVYALVFALGVAGLVFYFMVQAA